MASLSDPKILKYDTGNSMRFLESFPEDCRFAFEEAVKIFNGKKLDKQYKKYAIFGMGGSGISANIIQGMFPDIEIRVFKDYNLPKYIDHEYFCIAISYSGNTEETTFLLEETKKRNLKYIAIASDGVIGNLQVTEGCHIIKVPAKIVPRFSISHMFFSLLGFFHATGFHDFDNDMKEAFSVLEDFKKDIIFSNDKHNPAKEIAFSLNGDIPVVYGFGPFSAVAMRAKEQFNENSKVPSFYEIMPNADHNAIEGWLMKKLSGRIAVIIIRDKESESMEMNARLDLTRDAIKKAASSVIELRPVGKSLLAKIFSLIYLIDYVSFYLGLLNGIDPASIDNIEELKKSLKERYSKK